MGVESSMIYERTSVENIEACLDASQAASWRRLALDPWGRLVETTDEEGDAAKQILRMIREATPSNSLFVTEKGYLGLAKDNGRFVTRNDQGGLRPGDSIFILSGGNMPFGLRESELVDKSTTHGEKSWKVFNPCYVHGFMDGEQNERLSEEQGGYTNLKIV